MVPNLQVPLGFALDGKRPSNLLVGCLHGLDSVASTESCRLRVFCDGLPSRSLCVVVAMMGMRVITIILGCVFSTIFIAGVTPIKFDKFAKNRNFTIPPYSPVYKKVKTFETAGKYSRSMHLGEVGVATTYARELVAFRPTKRP